MSFLCPAILDIFSLRYDAFVYCLDGCPIYPFRLPLFEYLTQAILWAASSTLPPKQVNKNLSVYIIFSI